MTTPPSPACATTTRARVRADQTPAWAALQQHFAQSGQAFDVRDAFAQDAQRFNALSQQAPYVFADLSKNRLDQATHRLLLDLARQSGVEAHRNALFAGEPVNTTENRAVMHWMLRKPNPAGVTAASDATRSEAKTAAQATAEEALALVHATLRPMLAYAERVRADPRITDVVNIGIGGSDLGPHMAVLALERFAIAGKRMHFVSNVDGHELAAVLQRLQPESTLFLIASKTFTTAETMTNAWSARAWFEAHYTGAGATADAHGGGGLARHFAALTSNVAAAQAFGIRTTFGFWDWVGGRYSLWSAIGLPVAIAIGAQGFTDMLAGAHAMDEHFRTAPLESNLPVTLGLLDVWYRNFHGFTSRCVAPYHSALKRLPAYLQQLEMESNGKGVDASGQTLPFATCAVLWGELGANGQHAFFQMLHQGTDVVPVEFIAVKQARHGLPGHQQKLLANVLAQSQALMIGQVDAAGHKHFPGNRPSTVLLLDDLTPASLGALLALYEHRVFVAGSVWGINSFDQWGVELGKMLALDIEARMKARNFAGLDGSTQGLLQRLTESGSGDQR